MSASVLGPHRGVVRPLERAGARGRRPRSAARPRGAPTRRARAGRRSVSSGRVSPTARNSWRGRDVGGRRRRATPRPAARSSATTAGSSPGSVCSEVAGHRLRVAARGRSGARRPRGAGRIAATGSSAERMASRDEGVRGQARHMPDGQDAGVGEHLERVREVGDALSPVRSATASKLASSPRTATVPRNRTAGAPRRPSRCRSDSTTRLRRAVGGARAEQLVDQERHAAGGACTSCAETQPCRGRRRRGRARSSARHRRPTAAAGETDGGPGDDAVHARRRGRPARRSAARAASRPGRGAAGPRAGRAAGADPRSAHCTSSTTSRTGRVGGEVLQQPGQGVVEAGQRPDRDASRPGPASASRQCGRRDRRRAGSPRPRGPAARASRGRRRGRAPT